MKQQYTIYHVTRDPKSQFPELAGLEGIILETDHLRTTSRGETYTVTVAGSGARLEQQLNSAPSVRSFREVERNWFTPYPQSDDDISDTPIRRNRKGEWVNRKTSPHGNGQTYTVLSTSGWQGDHWVIAGTFDSMKDAAEFRASVRTNEARERGYITAIVRSGGRPCLLHSGDCWIFNLTSKKYRNFERHLRGTVHAAIEPEA